jgi:hypothetical protein
LIERGANLDVQMKVPDVIIIAIILSHLKVVIIILNNAEQSHRTYGVLSKGHG